jgi:hypothetical protein
MAMARAAGLGARTDRLSDGILCFKEAATFSESANVVKSWTLRCVRVKVLNVLREVVHAKLASRGVIALRIIVLLLRKQLPAVSIHPMGMVGIQRMQLRSLPNSDRDGYLSHPWESFTLVHASH